MPTRRLIFCLSKIFVIFLAIHIELPHTRCLEVNLEFCLKSRISSKPYLTECTMSRKNQKLSSKRSRAIEEPAHDYDHEKFVNASTAEKFGLISKNRSFIKEKGFHHPDDFFRKTITNKGWMALCQPPRLTTTMVVREFYANLVAHVLKKVQVCGVLVDFSAKSINEFYNLGSINPEECDRLHETPNYPEVLRMLTNCQGEWKLNNEGHVVHFKAKHLAYIQKVWPHFITSQRPMYVK